MNPAGRIRRLRIGVPVVLLAFLAFSCGSGFDVAGGGTGGTGISTGAVSGFGSVIVSGVHFRTDDDVAPGFKTKKESRGDKSGRPDQEVFAVGMVVTVRHGAGDNNAQEIEYRDNLRGPIAGITPGTDNIIEVLGQTIVVDDNTIFDGTTFAFPQRGDVVEVSGFADSAGRIRAAYILTMGPPMPPPFQKFEVKGFVSRLSNNTFRLGPLPDGSGMTVAVSYDAGAMTGLSGGLDNGMFVQVTTTNMAPVAESISASLIERLTPRTEFPDGAAVDLEGLVTAPPSGSGKVLSFAVEGKRIRTNDATDFTGHSPAEIQPDTRLLVRGTETGGDLFAARIDFR